jgi:RNA polymerase-binding protein DksA
MSKVASRSKSRTAKAGRTGQAARTKVGNQRLDFKHFQELLMLERKRLTDERDRIRSRAQQTEGTLPADDNWEVDEDSGDVSSSMLEKEIDMSLEGSFEEMIEAVDAALQKIKDKTYGVCDMCGRAINKIRLERIPFATLCVECQSLIEQM